MSGSAYIGILTNCALAVFLQRGGDPVEVFGLLAPGAVEDKEAASEYGSAVFEQQAENEVPVSPASSVRSAVSLASQADSVAGSKRSRIPTLSRAGLADRTNIG